MSSPDPNPPQDPPKRTFLVTAFPTLDPCLEARWEKSIGIAVPSFARATVLHPGQPFDLLVLFAGYGIDPHMLANVTFDWALQGPKGKTVLGESEVEAIKGRVLHGDMVMRAKRPLRLQLPENLPEGEYRVRVHAHCAISDRDAEDAASVKIQKFKLGNHFKSGAEVEAWMEGYLANPSPEKTLDALLTALEHIAPDAPDTFFAVLSFCAEVVATNDWLARAAETLLTQMPEGHRYALNLLLHPGEFPTRESLLAHPIGHPQQLDLLWAKFRAGGSYAVFRHLVSAMGPLPDPIAEAIPEEVRMAIAQSAAWSLDRHLGSTPLAKAYAVALLRDETIHPVAHHVLEGLLNRHGIHLNLPMEN